MTAGSAGAGGDPRNLRGFRVAFIVGLASGGTVAHVGSLAAGCRDAGMAVAVLAPPPTLQLLPAGIDTVPIGIGDRPRPGRDAGAICRLRSWLTGWRPDVLHAHGVRAGALAAVAIAVTRRAARPGLVITIHNAPPDGRAAAVVHAVLEWICARRADLVLCASADLLARMRSRGAAEAERFDVPAAPQQPPTAAEMAVVRREISADGRPVILTVGRLAEQKGLDVLIEAAARWRDRDPRPVTVIAGAGPLRAALAARARQFNGDVRLLGVRRDVPALLAIADVVAVPSRWEARALIVQEAMRAGRPIVATRVGGIPELTGPDGAVLVPARDPAALAAAVSAVLDDPGLADRLGRAARARSAAFPTDQDALRAALASYARLADGRRDGASAPRGTG
jgi:glycosyltransferase involved in cell wall biosynthesis